MTGSILKRLVWKEYRLLRGFWWAMLLAALFGQLYALWMTRMPGNAYWAFLVGVGLTACYALGCGATAFAGERESGTYALQRVMPVTPPELLAGKVLYAVISTLALGLAVWLVALTLIYVRSLGDNPLYFRGSYTQLAVLGAFKSIELLVWGVFYSLLLSKPLRAVVLAALTTAIVAYPLSWLMSDIPVESRTLLYFPSFLGDTATLIPRAVIVLLVVGADIFLVSRWFRRQEGDVAESNRREIAAKGLARQLAARSARSPQHQRLFWQLLVRSRWMLSTAALVYLLLLLFGLTIKESFDNCLLIRLFIPVGALLGIFTYADDQLRHQFRFFAEHGVSPRRLWWSRQLFWFAMLATGLLIVTAAEFTVHRNEINSGLHWLAVGAYWGAAALVYAVGQLCSQWIRSTLIAVTVMIPWAICLTWWSVLVFFYDVQPWVTAAPIPLILMLAGWATVNDWVKERTMGRALLRKVALLVVPTVVIGSIAIGVRWLQFPAVTPQFTTAGYSEEDLEWGEETAKIYSQLGSDLRDSDWQDHLIVETDTRDWKYPRDIASDLFPPDADQWLGEHQDLVQRALDVSQRHNKAFPDPRSYPFALLVYDAQEIVTISAQLQQRQGNLVATLDQYLAAMRIGRHESQRSWYFFREPIRGEGRLLHHLRYWAAEPGQTPQRIRRALDELEQVWALPFEPEISIANRYHGGIAALSDVAAGRGDDWVRNSGAFYWIYRLMPWELARSKRLVAVGAQESLDSLNEWRGSQSSRIPYLAGITRDGGWIERWSHLWSYRQDTTPSPLNHTVLSPRDGLIGPSLARVETARRGTQLVLALEGWRMEHGQLPKSLEELVPDWFDELPLDPMTVKPFNYHRLGKEEEFAMEYYAGAYSKLHLPANTPYLEADDPYWRTRTMVFPIEGAVER